MTQSYWPFDSGAGANVQEAQWAKMAKHWRKTGVLPGELNELAVSASTPAAMSVSVASGRFWSEGHFFESDAATSVSINSNPGPNNRIDRIIVRLDWTNNQITLEPLEGTAAASPSAPSLTQSTAIWEESLAQVSVPSGTTAIQTAAITDERGFSGQVEMISSTVLTADAASIDFQNIPATYRHLYVEISGRSSGAGAQTLVSIRLNNDSGANYYTYLLQATGGTPTWSVSTSGGATSGPTGYIPADGDGTTYDYGTIGILIADYRGTHWRTIRSSAGLSGYLWWSINRWTNAVDVVNRVTLIGGSNFKTGTRVSLFGVH